MPSIGTSRGADEAAADYPQCVNSYMKINCSYIFRKLITYTFYCILDTTNVDKTHDYLFLKKEMHFAKPLILFMSGAGLNVPRRCVCTVYPKKKDT